MAPLTTPHYPSRATVGSWDACAMKGAFPTPVVGQRPTTRGRVAIALDRAR